MMMPKSKTLRRPTLPTPEEEQERAAFLGAGKASSTLQAPQPTPPPSPRGRRPLPEQIKRMQIGLRQEDVDALEMLVLKWKRAAGVSSSVPITAVVRSLLATTLPVLEDMHGVEDEADLRARLEKMMQQ